MDTNHEFKTKDTYGSKMRNLLSPFYNMLTVIYSNSRQDDMSIPDDELLNFLRYSKTECWEAYKKLLELSYTFHLERTEYPIEDVEKNT